MVAVTSARRDDREDEGIDDDDSQSLVSFDGAISGTGASSGQLRPGGRGRPPTHVSAVGEGDSPAVEPRALALIEHGARVTETPHLPSDRSDNSFVPPQLQPIPSSALAQAQALGVAGSRRAQGRRTVARLGGARGQGTQKVPGEEEEEEEEESPSRNSDAVGSPFQLPRLALGSSYTPMDVTPAAVSYIGTSNEAPGSSTPAV